MCCGDAFVVCYTALVHICRTSCPFEFPDNGFAKSHTKLQVHVFREENSSLAFMASFGPETFNRWHNIHSCLNGIIFVRSLWKTYKAQSQIMSILATCISRLYYSCIWSMFFFHLLLFCGKAESMGKKELALIIGGWGGVDTPECRSDLLGCAAPHSP